MANKYPAVIFLELISRDNILLCHLSNNSYIMKSVQEPLCQPLQMAATSKMLQVLLCLDVLFEHFRQSSNKTKYKMSVKNVHCNA